MIVLRELGRRARHVVSPVLGLSLAGYFAYHLVEGDRGFLAWRQMAEHLRVETARLAALRAEREALARHDSDLKPDHLDPDLLDERVRSTLDFAAPGEIVILERPPAK